MKCYRLLLLLSLLALTLGCGSEPEPAPPLDEETREAIEAEDAAIEEAESQQ